MRTSPWLAIALLGLAGGCCAPRRWDAPCGPAAPRAVAAPDRGAGAGGSARPAPGPARAPEQDVRIARSVENLRTMWTYYVAADLGLARRWPGLSGKRLVLWLVAANRIDRRNPAELALLFSPGDARRSLAAVGPSAYERVTLDTLRDPAFDPRPLTSYVGRRSAGPAHLVGDVAEWAGPWFDPHAERNGSLDETSNERVTRRGDHVRVLTAHDLVADAPVLADLSFPDVALVAFASGEVRVMTRSDLGLSPGDPIAAGDASRSPILRALGE